MTVGFTFGGMSAKAFFGTAKSLGNPTGGGGTVAPVKAMLSHVVQGLGGFLATGITPVTGALKTATRFNASFAALAQHTADVFPAGLSGGVLWGFFINAATSRFVIQDSNGNVSDSTDGVTWHLGSNISGDLFGGHYGLVYDDVHSVIVAMDNTTDGGVLTAANTRPVTFTFATPLPGGCASVGYKGPATGILLAHGGPGGAVNSNVYKSTDGGVTWALVGNTGFTSGGLFIGFGSTHWVAFGTNGTNLQASVSTNDGATWSAPVNVSAANAADAAVATNGTGAWEVITAASAPSNYALSTDDGVTWTTFNLPPEVGSLALPGALLWSGTEWMAAWADSTATFNFLATSVDGQHWTLGDTVMDTPS